MGVIVGYESSVYLIDTTQNTAAFTTEATTANADRTVYRITNPAKRWWDPSQAVTASVAPTAGIAHAGGAIPYSPGLEAGTEVTVTGKYFTAVNKLGGSKSWSMDLQKDMLDVTSWDTVPAGFREYEPLLKGGTVAVERWWFDEFFLGCITAGTLLGLELRFKNGVAYYVYGHLTADSVKNATDSALSESLNIQITGIPQYIDAA
ncbi:MAG: hypothetical protein VB144_11500 [Clostridia bacterium]|nr:hypothetical protein [Clostridia bacterium]